MKVFETEKEILLASKCNKYSTNLKFIKVQRRIAIK